MLDIKYIREHPEEVQNGAATKNIKVDIQLILETDSEIRKLSTELESLSAEKNKASTLIAKANPEQKNTLLIEMKAVDQKSEELKKQLTPLQERLQLLLSHIPNLPRPDVPIGKNDSENIVVKTVGEKTRFDFSPVDYLTLAERLDLIDVPRAGKVSGSRFGYLKNQVVLLEFALIRFALDTLLPNGFTPILPPVLIKKDSMKAMGYLEHGGEDETYYFEKDDLFLVGTSEQSIGPMHRDEILKEEELPLRYVAFSPCFRREAGSYGKDTKGILRVHQFDKVEMFVYTTPDQSDQEHEYLLSVEEKLMQQLGLPYQVIKMCTGDLGDPAARKYDIETWIPSENTYRETHSTSTCTDYQSRRLNIRFKSIDKKNQFVHMLNGTAFAMGRTIIAILENYQQKDGSIRIPEVLQPYTGFSTIQ